MIPKPHGLLEEELAALSRGGGGAHVVRSLAAARRSRTLLLIRFIVGAARGDVRVRHAYQVLGQVQRAAPDAFRRVLEHPSVGAWATRTAAEPRRGGSAPAGLARVALAAAVRGRVSATVWLPPAPPEEVISLPSLGTAVRAAPGELRARCGPDGADLGAGVRVPAAWWEERPGWRPAARLAVDSAGARASFQLNGWAPGELPTDLRVSASPDVARWRTGIAEGWDLLAHHHREVAEELVESVTVLTPLQEPPGGGVNSATVVDAFGCLFLSLASDAESVALTLAHELQHTKLNAVMDLYELAAPVPGERFYAPWREDPRPLVGLLHGTYAYIGVTGFWRRQREHARSADARLRAHVEFARWRVGTLEAARRLLATGRLTAIGRGFVTGMAEVLQRWCAEPVPSRALVEASRRATEHRDRWTAR
jgi:HEXXH motif-containing protein